MGSRGREGSLRASGGGPPRPGGRVLSSVCGEELTMQEWQTGKDARDDGIHAPCFTQEETEAQVHTAINGQHWEINHAAGRVCSIVRHR